MNNNTGNGGGDNINDDDEFIDDDPITDPWDDVVSFTGRNLLLQEGGADVKKGKLTELKITWDDFVDRLENPLVAEYTFADYTVPTHEHLKLQRKSANGYWLKGPANPEAKNARGKVKRRQTLNTHVIACDFDAAPADFDARFKKLFGKYVWVAHTTHSSSPTNKRVRAVFPLRDAVSHAEAEAITLWIFSTTGWWHGSTESVVQNQAMFFPVIASDQEYGFYESGGTQWLDGKSIINMIFPDGIGKEHLPMPPEEYVTERKQRSQKQKEVLRAGRAKKQGVQDDPFGKPSWASAFCETYSIERAVEMYIPHTYFQPHGDAADRMRYSESTSGTSGVALFERDNGEYHPDGGHVWAFSYHGSDPHADILMNAYDMCRRHLFGDTDVSKTKMNNLCREDPMVVQAYEARQAEAANRGESVRVKVDAYQFTEHGQHLQQQADMMDVPVESVLAPNTGQVWDMDPPTQSEDDRQYRTHLDWIKRWVLAPYWEKEKLQLNQDAVEKIMLLSRELNCFWFDEYTNTFRCRQTVLMHERYWKEDERIPVEFVRNIIARYIVAFFGGNVTRQLETVIIDYIKRERSYDRMKEWFANLPAWDGVPRIGGMFHRYLGAPDDDFTNTVCAKFFSAVAARAAEIHPEGATEEARKRGVQYHQMPVLIGAQGLGKTSFTQAIVPQRSWVQELGFDILTNPKRLIEETRTATVVEMGELVGGKRDIDANKRAISASVDTARVAFAQESETKPRRFVLIGTTNEDDFLQDLTGNRRMIPIYCTRETQLTEAERSQIRTDVPQLYAEALAYLKVEPLMYQKPEHRERLTELSRDHMATEIKLLRNEIVDAIEWIYKRCQAGQPWAVRDFWQYGPVIKEIYDYIHRGEVMDDGGHYAAGVASGMGHLRASQMKGKKFNTHIGKEYAKHLKALGFKPSKRKIPESFRAATAVIMPDTYNAREPFYNANESTANSIVDGTFFFQDRDEVE